MGRKKVLPLRTSVRRSNSQGLQPWLGKKVRVPVSSIQLLLWRGQVVRDMDSLRSALYNLLVELDLALTLPFSAFFVQCIHAVESKVNRHNNAFGSPCVAPMGTLDEKHVLREPRAADFHTFAEGFAKGHALTPPLDLLCIKRSKFHPVLGIFKCKYWHPFLHCHCLNMFINALQPLDENLTQW